MFEISMDINVEDTHPYYLIITNDYNEIEHKRLVNMCDEYRLFHTIRQKRLSDTPSVLLEVTVSYSYRPDNKVVNYFRLGDIVDNKVKLRFKTRENALEAANQLIRILVRLGDESKQELIRLQAEKDALDKDKIKT